jgi:hypothetical protein
VGVATGPVGGGAQGIGIGPVAERVQGVGQVVLRPQRVGIGGPGDSPQHVDRLLLHRAGLAEPPVSGQGRPKADKGDRPRAAIGQ